MFKSIQILSIVLLSLRQCMNCQQLDEDLQAQLELMSAKVINCSNFFKYACSSEGYIIGELTLPNMKLGDMVKLEFKGYIFKYKSFKGIFLPVGNSNEIISKLKNSNTIQYRIDLPVDKTLIPYLENISINDNKLCTETPIPLTDKYTFQHTLEIINGNIPVYTNNNNIYMPHFTEVATPSCGIADTEITDDRAMPLIYGGIPIKHGEFPWLVAIYKKQMIGISFICAGSLVTSQFVLTAAHCIREYNLRAEDILVLLGRHKLTQYDSSIVMKELEMVIIQPDYNRSGTFADADLALLKLQRPVSFTKYIRPICLWNEPTVEPSLTNETAVVVGWGSDEIGNSLTDIPKKITLSIVSRLECITSYLGLYFLTSARTLCAGKRDGTGPCKGDSGGGLMTKQNGIWRLRAVVSVGFSADERCDLKQYTVHCDITKHREWLDNELSSKVGGSACGITESVVGSKYEWLAAIYYKYYAGEEFQCTGVLISARHILIPAHCCSEGSANYLKVYLGRYNLSDIHESNVIARDVANVIRHPNFHIIDGLNIKNDIALIQVQTPISFTEYIKPICLWTGTTEMPQIVKQHAILLSWDTWRVWNESLTIPESMQVNLIPMTHCQQRGLGNKLKSSIICTPSFSSNNDGFLMLNSNGRWYLHGVGTGESHTALIRIYTEISEYLPWIRSYIL